MINEILGLYGKNFDKHTLDFLHITKRQMSIETKHKHKMMNKY